MHNISSYGQWSLVLLDSLVFTFLAFSFIKPQTRCDWYSLAAFFMFVVVMFTEMYGYPFSLYALSEWLVEWFPGIDYLSHENGYIIYTLLGGGVNPHWTPINVVSNLIIVFGFYMLSLAWYTLNIAQKAGTLATNSWYAYCRHPQYVALLLIMFGFVLQWPTISSVSMFPVLVVVYAKLAKQEEIMAIEKYGDAYRAYQKKTPRWFFHKFQHR